MHFICEAKQTDLYKEREEDEVLPQAFKRHKYGHRNSAVSGMDISNLALGQQKRSQPKDEDASTVHDQEKTSSDSDDEAHVRHKRALGEDFNGDDGQVLVDDTAAFQTNIDSHLNNIPNSKSVKNQNKIKRLVWKT